MVNALPLSDYFKYFKSAQMLLARNRVAAIQSASFPSYTEKSRDDVMRALKYETDRYLFKPLKDFADVAKNFAERLKHGR